MGNAVQQVQFSWNKAPKLLAEAEGKIVGFTF